jgi:hypothetical protein
MTAMLPNEIGRANINPIDSSKKSFHFFNLSSRNAQGCQQGIRGYTQNVRHYSQIKKVFSQSPKEMHTGCAERFTP